jgi:hypothetical protein
MRTIFDEYENIYAWDFEFISQPGERVEPVCTVVKNIRTGAESSFWRDDLKKMKALPFDLSSKSLFVGYYTSADLTPLLAMNMGMPTRVIDLYAEFRNKTNGLPAEYLPGGHGLLGAATCYGLDGMRAAEKERMRSLILSGGPWDEAQKNEIIEYCADDVRLTSELFKKMAPDIECRQALLRGEYMKTISIMEHNGIPLDLDLFNRLNNNWDEIKVRLVEKISAKYDVFDETTFKIAKFQKWLVDNHIPWRYLPSGKLDLKEETFKEMSKIYPLVSPIHEVRSALAKMRLSDLQVGADGRNRAMLSPFASKTGRNQPSTSKYIFGLSSWARNMIRPAPGFAIANIDFSQQEFAIAAALSRDENMMGAYRSGDPYMEFAIQSGMAPKGATKKTHGAVREQCKTCILAVQYGMGPESLAQKLHTSLPQAKHLLRLHKDTYPTFWSWSDNLLDTATLTRKLQTVFGWTLKVVGKLNDRSIRNFPMQANGAEILRLSCIYATNRGIKLLAPIHDAILIEAPIDQIEEAVRITQEEMANASKEVLSGFEIRSDAKIIKYPDRYGTGTMSPIWEMISEILEDPRAGGSRPTQPCVPVQSTSISLS